MRESIYDRSESVISQWWLAAIIGVVAVAVGFIVLVNPIASYLSAAVWLGIAIFISGIMSLIISLSSDNIVVRRGWAIFASIIDVIIGFSLMFYILCWKKDTRRDQSDIQLCGVFLSYLYIATFLLLNISLIIYSLSGGVSEPMNIIEAVKHYFVQTWNDILMVVDLVRS